MIRSAYELRYTQIIELSLGVLSIAFGFALLRVVLRYDTIIVDADEILTRNLFGQRVKKVNLKEINFFTAIKKSSKYSKWEDLTIYTNKDKYEISSCNYASHEIIKKKLTRGRRRNKTTEKKWYSKVNIYCGFALLIFGLMLIALILIPSKKKSLILS